MKKIEQTAKIRFGIIGAGNIGIRHIQKIAENPDCELAGIADVNPERFLPEQECPYHTTDYTELITRDDVDVISVCTPNHLHAEMTIRALQAKKHVICEKPMALSEADCRSMISAAEQTKKKLFIVKQNRHNPPVQIVRQWLDSGTLGEVFQITMNCFWNRDERYYSHSDWKGKLHKDGGALYTQFSHFLDLLLWFGGEASSVYAATGNFDHPYIEIEDSGSLIIRFKNNTIGTVLFSNCAFKKNMEGSLTLFCKNGTVKVGGQYLNELEYQEVYNQPILKLPVSHGANDYGTYQGTMSNHHKVYENVVSVLRRNGSIDVNGSEGMQTVRLIEAAYKSAQINMPVSL